LLRLAR
ncbi:hypothetical protein EC970003_1619B, partial [Escherichia coli 97.0003]